MAGTTTRSTRPHSSSTGSSAAAAPARTLGSSSFTASARRSSAEGRRRARRCVCAPLAASGGSAAFRGSPQRRGRRHRRDVGSGCRAAAAGGVGQRRHGRLAAVLSFAAGIRPAASLDAAEFQRICDRVGEGGAAQGMTDEKLAEILADESNALTQTDDSLNRSWPGLSLVFAQSRDRTIAAA
jgi:hypothetical protein